MAAPVSSLNFRSVIWSSLLSPTSTEAARILIIASTKHSRPAALRDGLQGKLSLRECYMMTLALSECGFLFRSPQQPRGEVQSEADPGARPGWGRSDQLRRLPGEPQDTPRFLVSCPWDTRVHLPEWGRRGLLSQHHPGRAGLPNGALGIGSQLPCALNSSHGSCRAVSPPHHDPVFAQLVVSGLREWIRAPRLCSPPV